LRLATTRERPDEATEPDSPLRARGSIPGRFFVAERSGRPTTRTTEQLRTPSLASVCSSASTWLPMSYKSSGQTWNGNSSENTTRTLPPTSRT